MNAEGHIRRWAKLHKTNLNNLLRRFKKMTKLEKIMFIDEMKRNT